VPLRAHGLRMAILSLSGVMRLRKITFAAVWVPIIHPCWSGSVPVLVEGATEPVPSADIQLRDPFRIGNRFG